MNVEEHEWVGIIQPEDVQPGATYITPLAFFAEGEWKPLALTARRQWFPNKGKAIVSTGDVPPDIGRLMLFHPERNMQLAHSSYGYTYYTVAGALERAPLAQIIDWTAKAKESYELIDLLEKGIAEKDCFCQRIYIYCHERLYGPVKVALDGDRFKPHEYLQYAEAAGQPLFVWMYTLPEDGFLDLTYIHKQFTFLDESMLDTPTGKEDWSLAQVTIKRILEASNTASADGQGDLRLVGERLDELDYLTSRAELFALHLEPATIKRAQHIVTNQIERLQELQEMIAQLHSEHPLMKIAREWAIVTRSEEIEQEATMLLLEKQQHLSQLQLAIEAAESKLAELQRAADEVRQRYEQSVEAFTAFESALQTRLTALKEQPAQFLADLHIAAALLPMLGGGNGQSFHEIAARDTGLFPSQSVHHTGEMAGFPVHGLNWNAGNGALSKGISLDELASHLVAVARTMNVRSSNARICAAALLAGLIPALTGESAISTLQAISQVISQKRFVLVPVPVAALSALDLFGTIDTTRRMFIPATGGLADCILQAQEHPEELVLVVLEGVDRVPGMPVYVPLLRQYIQARQSQAESAPVNLFHPHAVHPEDPYSKLAWFTWPRNVLLAVTSDGDMNSLPFPSQSDRWLVHFEATLAKKSSADAKKSPSCAEIPLNQWQSWEQEVHARAKTAVDAELQEILDFRQQAFYAALTMLRVKEPDTVVEDIWPEQFEQEGEEELD